MGRQAEGEGSCWSLPGHRPATSLSSCFLQIAPYTGTIVQVKYLFSLLKGQFTQSHGDGSHVMYVFLLAEMKCHHVIKS